MCWPTLVFIYFQQVNGMQLATAQGTVENDELLTGGGPPAARCSRPWYAMMTLLPACSGQICHICR